MSRMETEMFFVSQGFFSRFFEAVRTCPECRNVFVSQGCCFSCFFEAFRTCPECRLEWFCQFSFFLRFL